MLLTCSDIQVVDMQCDIHVDMQCDIQVVDMLCDIHVVDIHVDMQCDIHVDIMLTCSVTFMLTC